MPLSPEKYATVPSAFLSPNFKFKAVPEAE